MYILEGVVWSGEYGVGGAKKARAEESGEMSVGVGRVKNCVEEGTWGGAAKSVCVNVCACVCRRKGEREPREEEEKVRQEG